DPDCACPKPGVLRKYRQRRTAAVARARGLCAKATPPVAAIPDPCDCECHVRGCCEREDGTRAEHRSWGGVFGTCGCRQHERQACSIDRSGPRVLATKIDTLWLSWHAEIAQEVYDFLEAKRKAA